MLAGCYRIKDLLTATCHTWVPLIVLILIFLFHSFHPLKFFLLKIPRIYSLVKSAISILILSLRCGSSSEGAQPEISGFFEGKLSYLVPGLEEFWSWIAVFVVIFFFFLGKRISYRDVAVFFRIVWLLEMSGPLDRFARPCGFCSAWNSLFLWILLIFFIFNLIQRMFQKWGFLLICLIWAFFFWVGGLGFGLESRVPA